MHKSKYNDNQLKLIDTWTALIGTMKSIYLKHETRWITRVHNIINNMKLISVYMIIPSPLSLLNAKHQHSVSPAALVLQILYINMHTSINRT